MKEIERPEALDIYEFGALHEGEYVMEFLLSFTFRDHIMDLDNGWHSGKEKVTMDDLSFSQYRWRSKGGCSILGGVKRSMTMRPFILALGLYTPEDMGNVLFEPFRESCFRNRPKNYNPTEYFISISTHNHYDTRHLHPTPQSKAPFVVWRIDCLSCLLQVGTVVRRKSLWMTCLFHSIDGGVRVDVLLYVDKFFTDKSKGYKKKSLIMGAHLIRRIAKSFGLMTQGYLRSVTLGPETLLLNVAKMVNLGIYRYNGLGYGELVDDILDNAEDERVVDDDAGGVRRRPKMSFTNKLRMMDERLVRSVLWRVQANKDGAREGVNFMSSTPVYSTAPSQSPSQSSSLNQFGLFGDANAGPSTLQNQGNGMNEE
nr:hypothetical protein [Tanacetum cinerariifolium]